MSFPSIPCYKDQSAPTARGHAGGQRSQRRAAGGRTKDVLAAKKARGHQLGTPANLTDEARVKGQQQRQENARASLANWQAAELAQL